MEQVMLLQQIGQPFDAIMALQQLVQEHAARRDVAAARHIVAYTLPLAGRVDAAGHPSPVRLSTTVIVTRF